MPMNPGPACALTALMSLVSWAIVVFIFYEIVRLM